MIKWFKNLFCKIINVKQCECPEPEVLVVKEKPKHCSGHNRFRKSCPFCQEIVA